MADSRMHRVRRNACRRRYGPGDLWVLRDERTQTNDEIDGGHCVALSRPKELAERLDAFRAETNRR